MGMKLGGDSDEVLSEINVTPLVDVMLVLLIIFMIAAPMLHQGVEVTLPQAQAQSLPQRDPDPMVLTVTRDEIVYVKDDPIHPSQLEERLAPLMAARDDQSVFIKADKDVPYGSVAEVIDILNRSETYRIGLVMDTPRR